jgi:hypothetical protein
VGAGVGRERIWVKRGWQSTRNGRPPGRCTVFYLGGSRSLARWVRIINNDNHYHTWVMVLSALRLALRLVAVPGDRSGGGVFAGLPLVYFTVIQPSVGPLTCPPPPTPLVAHTLRSKLLWLRTGSTGRRSSSQPKPGSSFR